MQIQTSIETITPNIAHAYLERNIMNRRPLERAVAKLATDMSKGNWYLTGDTIKFDNEGVLIDGQHRLMAVIRCGLPQQFLVVRNVAKEAKIATDTGKPRTLSNVLEFDNCKNSKEVACITKAAYEFHYGKQNMQRATSHFEMVEFLNEHPEIHESATWNATNRKYFGTLGSMSMWGAVHFATGTISHEMREEYFSLFKLPPQNAKHPITVARNTLAINYKRGRFTASRNWVWAVAIKSWNAMVEGREVSMFKYGIGERFPTMNGYQYAETTEDNILGIGEAVE
jgi:hypothetical protein